MPGGSRPRVPDVQRRAAADEASGPVRFGGGRSGPRSQLRRACGVQQTGHSAPISGSLQCVTLGYVWGRKR